MSMRCPADLDTNKLQDEIRSIYERVALEPTGEFHFHRGPDYAAAWLDYDPSALSALPPECTAPFAGVGNPHLMGPIGQGATVVDVGCGAGMDLLLAARSAGPRGRAVGVDMTEAMLDRVRSAAAAVGLDTVEVRLGQAAALPLPDGFADVVISNGVMNLTPDKGAAFREVLRILRPGGRFLYADLVVASELSEAARRNVDLWTG